MKELKVSKHSIHSLQNNKWQEQPMQISIDNLSQACPLKMNQKWKHPIMDPFHSHKQ